MNKEKQIEEMVTDIEEAKREFKRLNKDILLIYGDEIPNRENYLCATYLTEAKGYRKSADVAEEIFREIEKSFIEFYDKTITYSSPTLPLHIREAAGFALNEMFMKITELKKKYTEDGAE